MMVRSIALMICALALCFEAGISIAGRDWGLPKKAMMFCSLSCVLFCVAMVLMFWFLRSTLEDQQEDTFLHLQAAMYIPPNGNVYASEVTTTNGGSWEIGRYVTECYLVSAEQGLVSYKGLGEISKQDGTFILYIPPPGQPLSLDDFMENVPLSKGGDGETRQCIRPLVSEVAPSTGASTRACVDVRVFIGYQLQTQLGISKIKEFRFVAKPVEGQMRWSKQAVEYPGSYCPG